MKKEEQQIISEYRSPSGCLFGAMVFAVIVTLLFALLICSCSTTKCLPEKIIERHDSIITKTQRDSVYVYERDSVLVDRGGDTVYVTRWKVRYRDHMTNKVDTIYRDRLKNVVEVRTERYIPQYYKFCSWAFWIVLVLVLLRVAWWAFKTFYF